MASSQRLHKSLLGKELTRSEEQTRLAQLGVQERLDLEQPGRARAWVIQNGHMLLLETIERSNTEATVGNGLLAMTRQIFLNCSFDPHFFPSST